MGKFIIKITDPKDKKDYYMEWSTVVDAPVTWGMSLTEFKKYYKQKLIEEGMKELKERLKRVELTGSSGFHPYDSINDFFEFNRAGNNESCIKKKGILDRYCRAHIG